MQMALLNWSMLTVLLLTIMSHLHDLDLSVLSYNCRGFNDIKRDYIKSLLTDYKPVMLLLQEHWLSNEQLTKLDNIDTNFFSVGISGFTNHEILRGRPYGGCAILWRVDLKCVTESVSTTSNRLCVLRIESREFKLLIICVYFPHEAALRATSDLTEELAILENLINLYNDHHVIVGGDFNVDFNRCNNLHTTILNEFCDHADLRPTVKHVNNTIDFTYHFNIDRFSTIDHFILSSGLFDRATLHTFAIPA